MCVVLSTEDSKLMCAECGICVVLSTVDSKIMCAECGICVLCYLL